jgi:transposase, IS6 family
MQPAAHHLTERYGDNRIEAEYGRLKARLRPRQELKRLASAAVVAAGHAFVQNLPRGHSELAVDVSPVLRSMAAFTELARAI